MKILAVDDEMLQLEKLEDSIYEAIPEAAVYSSRRTADALRMIEEMDFDIAFLDIQMRGATGVELAQKLKAKNPKINIIFVTAFAEYKSEAMDLKASGYITKPVNKDKIRAELAELRYPLQPVAGNQGAGFAIPVAPAMEPLLHIQCFGNFDVFSKDRTPIRFERSKAKEMLAYLVFRNGSRCTNRELANILFENREYDQKVQDSFRHVAAAMRKALRAAGAEKVLICDNQNYAIDVRLVECDYFRYLKSDPAVKNHYSGDFMSQYSWAEYVNAYLDSRL